MSLKYNLQFFAKDGPGGEKTEEPTSKKLEDARKEGQVSKSKEISNCVGLFSLFIVLKIFVGSMGNRFLGMFNIIYTRIPETVVFYEGNVPVTTLQALFKNVLVQILIFVAPFFIVGVLTSFVVDVVQVKWKVTTKPLQPKFSKLNPISGFKKIFGINSLIELLKSILKIFLIGYVVYSYLRGLDESIYLLYDITLINAISMMGDLIINLGIRISAVYVIIAAADYMYQKHKFKSDMKMTKQEVKDEMKNSEGDPQIKGQQRARMRQASQRRMMQQLPQADVVITNPTHFAVAIKYDAKENPAPVVIAKGEDFLAKRIKEVAKENNIEIVENKPLARMLYANVEVGGVVPPELYQAVAEVLAYVYHLQGKI